jgi:hypothetical protein
VTFGQEPANTFLPTNVDPSNPSHAMLNSPSGSTRLRGVRGCDRQSYDVLGDLHPTWDLPVHPRLA